MERGGLMHGSPIASKSVGSFVKIDSISIDLADAIDKSTSSHVDKCEHFTMRGYVSEIRKKDWKLCWPFDLDGDHVNKKFDQDQPTSVVPPLKTPNLICRSKSIANVNGTGIRCLDIGSNSNNIPTLLSDFQQGQLVEGKMGEAHASIIRNNEVATVTVIANEKALEHRISHEMPKLHSVETEVNPGRSEGRHKDDTEARKLEGNGPVLERDIAEKNIRKKNSTQSSEAECQAYREDNHEESMNGSGICTIPGMVDKEDNGTNVQTNNVNHPLVLDECDYTSSESQEKSSSGLNRKKSRKKVRLLSELWNKEDAKTDCVRVEESPSMKIGNTSGAGTVSQGQVSVQEKARTGLGENCTRTEDVSQGLVSSVHENGKAGVSDHKRKFPEEAEQGGCLEIGPAKSLNKKVKAYRRDEEATKIVRDSELEEDAVARTSQQADPKSNWNRYGSERIPTMSKKKTKTSNDFGACSSFLAPPADNAPIEALNEVGNSSNSNAAKPASFSLTYVASKVREIEQIPFPAVKAEGKSGFGKRTGKVADVDNGQDSLFPWTGMLRKGLKPRKDVVFTQTGHPFHMEEDASSGKGPDLSLNSCVAEQRCDPKPVPQPEGIFPPLSSWKDGSGKLDEFMRRNVEANYAANVSKNSKSVSHVYPENAVRGEHSGKFYTCSMPILNEKQTYNSRVDHESYPLQKMDMPRAKNKEKVVEVHIPSAVPVSRKRSNQRAEKMSQQGVADDIPMEIVEFMVKNQYERCLPDAEKKKHVLETSNKPRNGQVMMDHSYGIGDFRILEETSQKQKPRARKGKNGIDTRKNAEPAKQKPVDYSAYINGKDFSVSHLDEMHCPSGFFSQAQKKPTRDQVSAAGYGTCSCAQNCKWTGDVMGHGFSHLRSLATCNSCQSVSQSKEEAARLWSAGMPAHIPVTYSNPQMCPAQASDVNMLSHPPGSRNVNGGYGLNFLNLNASNREKHSEKAGSGTFSRTNAEYSFSRKHHGSEPHQNSVGSFDLYSNETIPAMHLLSLMDPGMRSGASFNMGGNPKFLKRPFSNDLDSTEYSARDIGVYKATDIVKHHPPSNCFGKKHNSEKSLDLFPMRPGGASTSSSVQHSNCSKRPSDSMSQVSLGFQKKEQAQSSRGPRPHKAAFTGGGFGKIHGTIPVMKKGFVTLSDPMMFPQQSQTIEHPMRQKLDAHTALGSMRPPNSSSESSICIVNRNPADFTFPEPGNAYMICGHELRVGKQFSDKTRPRLIKLDQKKRQRSQKQPTGKERAQN